MDQLAFWVLQLVILALYLVRLAATVAFHLDIDLTGPRVLDPRPLLVPVVYAALNYGLRGALFTAGWVTLLAVPRFLSAVHSHDYYGGLGRAPRSSLLEPWPFSSGSGSPQSGRPGGLPSPHRRPT